MMRITQAWNSRTPVYLHNGTKENLIFQLSLIGAFLAFMFARDKVRDARWRKAQTKSHLKIV